MLHDWADEPRPTTPHLGTAGALTGVVFHKNYLEGQIMSEAEARKLGAQLIRQADLHDAIYENGVDTGRNLRTRGS